MANGKISGTKTVYPTFNTSLFKTYSGSGNEPTIFERNGVVTLTGIVTPISQLPNTDGQLICTIPEGYRPNREIHAIQQGSSSNRWDCRITVDGSVFLQRYSNTTSNQTVGAGAYLPISVTYVI